MRKPASTVHVIAGLLAALCLLCAGCGSDGAKALPRATGLPAASALTADGTTVPAHRWGVVRFRYASSSDVVLAMRTTEVTHGKAGALKDVGVINNGGAVDPGTEVPYYAGFDFAVLAGDPLAEPGVNELSVTGTGAPGDVLALSVPEDLEKCATPITTSVVNYKRPGVGYEVHDCVVALAKPGAHPTALEFTAQVGSSGVRFSIPAD